MTDLRIPTLLLALLVPWKGAHADVQPDPRPISWQYCKLGGAGGNGSRVATGGTAVTLTSTGSLRGVFIQNPTTATESLFVDVSGAASTTAGTSIELAAGASYGEGPGTIHAGSLSINAATGGHAFVCQTGQ